MRQDSATDFMVARPFSKSLPTMLSQFMKRPNTLKKKLLLPDMLHVTKMCIRDRTYSHDQVSHGRPLPSAVTLQDLVGGGYISTNEVRDLGGADVTFYPTVSESDPQAVLVRVRMPDGSQTVALSDGSIQSLSR